VEDCFIESFNGNLRDECLNTHHLENLAAAPQHVEAWRHEYHSERPHRRLGATYASGVRRTPDTQLNSR
jgi:putative transposase